MAANNAFVGILVESPNGTAVSVMVRNSTIANNGANGGPGLSADKSAGATIRVTRSTITGNGSGWSATNNGFVLSYGDNNIDGNASVNTEPPGPLSYK